MRRLWWRLFGCPAGRHVWQAVYGTTPVVCRVCGHLADR